MTASTSPVVNDTQSTVSAYADKAKDLGARVSAAVSDQADALVDRLRPKIDAVGDYVRDEPTKAVLIAAATGAGLMALVALAAGRNSSRRLPDVDTSAVASALRDFAARAPKAASDASEQGKKKASAAADIIADTWAQFRDQATPVIDKIRPQLDAVTAYAKDDPVKAAAGVALAGALVAGLVAMLRSRDD